MSARTLRALVIAGLLGLAGAAQAAIPAGERTVLLNLYTSTGGATWTTSTNWNGAAGTECTWYGVTCDGGGTTVTQISLFNNNLTGSLPGNLNGLTNLSGFNVTFNQLTGSIPALTGLPNLNEFDVSHNQLTGPIPVLTGLPNLANFYADSNQLTGTIPALTGLTNLRTFAVRGNQLTGPIPALSGLTNLLGFFADNNQLTGSIPPLTGLTNLFAFLAPSNQLTGSIPALTGLTSLTYFFASNNQLTGPIPPLVDVTNLNEFDVSHNQLTGPIPALTGLTNLQGFAVQGNQLTGNVPSVPSPSALVSGGSSLCPNFLNQTADPAWDAATGVTPWFANCASAPLPPALLGAASRKVHGVAGTFDLPLSLMPVTNPTTEPRQGPAQAIVFTFDKPINAATVTVIEGSATAASPTFSANDVVVGLSNVTNQQYVTVSLTNVGASDGGTGGSGSVRIGFLLGDVSGNRVVTVSDLAQVNAQIAQVVTASNYLKDVSASGTLTVADKGIANTQITKALPAP